MGFIQEIPFRVRSSFQNQNMINFMYVQDCYRKDTLLNIDKSLLCKDINQDRSCMQSGLSNIKIQAGQRVIVPNDFSISIGWNCKDGLDIDISAYLLGSDRKVLSDDWFLFYGQPISPDGSMRLDVQEYGLDRRRIDVHTDCIDNRIVRIAFILTIDEALCHHYNFSMTKDVFLQIKQSHRVLYRFDLTNYDERVVSMVLGELYLHKGQWKFVGIGDGTSDDLKGLCMRYGVVVN